MQEFPTVIKNRDGEITTFDLNKIKSAIFKAAQTVGGKDEKKAEELAIDVARGLYQEYVSRGTMPTVDDSNSMCIKVLREKGYDGTADSFETYSKDRAFVRQNLQVRKRTATTDLTDQMLLIQSPTTETLEPWNRRKVADSIKKDYHLSPDLSVNLSKEIENDVGRLLKRYGTHSLSTSLIRKITEVHLLQRGIPLKNGSLSIPKSTLESLVHGNSKENSNITSNNPEAVNLGISEYILKQFNLDTVFSDNVKGVPQLDHVDTAMAHHSGEVHIHDLGYPQRVYCSSHSVEYIKKFGLNKVVSNLQNKSKPAKSAMVLNGHIQTFLASMQSKYAGALGFGFLNILYSPMLRKPTKLLEVDMNGENYFIKQETLEDLVSSGAATVENQDFMKNAYMEKLEECEVITGLGMLGTGEQDKKDCQEVIDSFKSMAQKNKIYGASYNALKKLEDLLFSGALANDETKKREYLESAKELGREARLDSFDERLIKKSAVKCNILKEVRKLKKMSKKEMKQIAQNLIFSASQNAFSRGGQTLFIDFNIHTGVPAYMKNVPALGPGGKYMLEDQEGNIEYVDEAPRFQGKDGDPRNGDVLQPENGRRYITYGDPRMVETAQEFAVELMKVWEEGDMNGKQFAFPKCDLHIGKETLEDPKQREVFRYGCKVAAKNGSTYFMFDRDSAGATLAQCCRLKEKITDMNLLKHPERVRFTGFQNITINLPQAAYKSKTGLEGVLENIDRSMEVAVKAHLQKKQYIQTLLDANGSPLRSLGIPSDDGTPYIDLNKSTYIIGLIGLNETVQYLTGKELHESREVYEMGLRIIDRMNQNVDKFKKKYGLKFILEETPAESATQKLAKGDLRRYPDSKKVIKGDLKKAPYYTNSIHLNPGAPISMTDRIELQSKFHDLIEAGSIIHVYCGEHNIPAESIENLIEKSYRNTRASQITISPEFTHCNSCHTNYRGFKDKCTREGCGSEDMTKRTKIVGYFSDLDGWNDSQLGISKAREAVSNQYANFSKTVDWLYDSDKSKKVMVFGKEGCSTCHDAKSTLERMSKETYGVPVEFYDLTKPESRIMAARYNVPLDPIPSIVVKNNGTSTVHEQEYRNGKPLHRNENHYRVIMESLDQK